MNSMGNLLREVESIDPSRFAICIVHYNGNIGEGTSWGYEGGGEPFRIEISPEQAVALAKLTRDGDAMGGRDMSNHSDYWIISSLPEQLVLREGDRIQITSACQTALYDFIE